MEAKAYQTQVEKEINEDRMAHGKKILFLLNLFQKFVRSKSVLSIQRVSYLSKMKGNESLPIDLTDEKIKTFVFVSYYVR